MRWTLFVILFILTFLLGASHFFRWSELETSAESGVQLSYKKDNWTEQTWVEYCPPPADCLRPLETPLLLNEESYESYQTFIQDKNNQLLSGQTVEAWRKRDLATYIWANSVVFSLLGTVLLLISNIKRKRW